MSQSKNGGNKPGGSRSLPSWMSSRDNQSDKKQKGDGEGEGQNPRQGRGRTSGKNSGESSSGTTNVSKLMEGVVFVLSGFVNPERSILRSQALEMGAEYQQDWTSDCTLLVCAFSSTPKFRQVEADCGTIVSKEWISECYTQKKLVVIESYLMHAGKPWRKSGISQNNIQDQTLSRPSRSKKEDGDSPTKQTASPTSKHVKAADSVREHFSPSKAKKWAVNDLKKTISWLESQEEKPDPDEIEQIAAEGILTCLQDAIASLEQKQDIQQITEQWNFIPRVVEELAKLESAGKNSGAIPAEDLCRLAKDCKRIYEVELRNLDDESSRKKKRKTERQEQDRGETGALCSDAAGYDSDETLVMTEEEIDVAYNTVAS
ncbi:DNA-repair protein XRCC1 [Argentina anserina]|uniref:DNA-repair protein XRCC1 n=1 Tax=Argentina anserina TaxID=57926 RepID=UPI00217668F8|nr:DNA-repair protein XRCC1 [Potentilla anserina]XP_050384731.1 DNA-repair protein XRCC1 [Potentilla anserina]XP_050384732.1 DNA-repair protein XRCC1 [Potentilla anserina]